MVRSELGKPHVRSSYTASEIAYFPTI